MHTDFITPDAGGSHRMKGSLRPQGDGRKPLPHIVTAVLSILGALAISHFSGVAQGPKGPPGTTTVISKPTTVQAGICAYFGRDSSGRTRLQITTPKQSASGAYCLKGSYISVVPQK